MMPKAAAKLVFCCAKRYLFVYAGNVRTLHRQSNIADMADCEPLIIYLFG